MALRIVVLTFLYGCAAVAEPLSLGRKAELFQRDMEARFLLDGQALCKLKRPTANRAFIAYNMPDNAYMTGIYTGMLAMKYAVTKAPEDRINARQSLDALHLLCTVSGTPGILARAAWPKDKPMEDDGLWRDSPCGRYRWRGDVSTDQVDGVMFGLALAYDLIAEQEDQQRIAADARAIVDHVLAHDMRIVDVDGHPTQWGRYGPEYVSRLERMNALLWLQAIKVTAHVTGDAKYEELYRHWALDREYATLSVAARRNFNPVMRHAVNHSDDVLLFLAYTPLLMYEQDPALLDLYRQSIRNSWTGGRYPGVAPEGNPFYAFVMAKFLNDESGVSDAIQTLRWFPLDLKWNRSTIAEYETQFGFAFDATVQSPEPDRAKPIPMDRREKTWSAWVQDPYLSAGDRQADSPIEYNGHDYLLGYWMGRYYGYIQAD